MRSTASRKFLSRHPTQHKLLISQIYLAKQSRSCPACNKEEKSEMTAELSNMRKNRDLVKFTHEDRLREEMRNNIKMMKKRIHWSENLIKIILH